MPFVERDRETNKVKATYFQPQQRTDEQGKRVELEFLPDDHPELQEFAALVEDLSRTTDPIAELKAQVESLSARLTETDSKVEAVRAESAVKGELKS